MTTHFERSLTELGLDRPWHWDFFLKPIEFYHQSGYLEIWFMRQTVWWNPAAGVTPHDRGC